MDKETVELMNDAIARHTAVVLSFPTAAGLLHQKSSILAGDETGVWVAAVGEQPLIEGLISGGTAIGVSFRAGGSRHVFAAPMLRYAPEYRVAIGTPAAALLLQFPNKVQTVQRRSDYRVRVSPDTELSVRCWRMPRRGDLRDRPAPGQELHTEVRDVSLGGLGVTFMGEGDEPPRISTDDRLRIELHYQDIQLLVEGRTRATFHDAHSGSIRTGIRFVFLQEGVRDRQTLAQLTRIVGELQRQEARSYRIAGKP